MRLNRPVAGPASGRCEAVSLLLAAATHGKHAVPTKDLKNENIV
jgi:hypothetical protein